jgi:STE24 endopeptidase
VEPIFTSEELAQVRAYAQPFYVWLAVRDGAVVAFYLLLLRFGVRPLFARAQGAAAFLDQRLSFARGVPVLRALPAALDRLWGGPGWGAALLFTLLYVVVLNAVFLPKSVYLDFIHEHRFGQSNYSGAGYAVDVLKSFTLTAVAQCLVAFGLFGLARRVRRWWLLLGVAAGLGLLAAPLLDPYRARIYFDQERLAEGPLRTEIASLLDRAQVGYGEVMVERASRASKVLQAYFAGQGPTRTVVLNDVLVETLDPDEVLAAVAHEAGHISEAKWPGRLMGSLVLFGFLFLAHRLLRMVERRRWFGVTAYADVRSFPLLALVLFLLLSLAHPLSAAVSRAREREADLFALELTKDAPAFRRMLVKAARTNKLDPEPPAWAVLRAHGHPSVAERLRAVAAWEASKNTVGR